MKNFEMPKMNVAIFSLENIVTESGTGTQTQANLDAAKAAIAKTGATEAQITVTTAEQWLQAE